MSVESAPYYWLLCDKPDCDQKSTHEDDDIEAWSDIDVATDQAINRDWWISDNESGDEKQYCPDHSPRCSQCESILQTDGTCCDEDEHDKYDGDAA